MKRHKKALGLNAEINITNLLDICFVLLICFMLIAPVMKHGIQIDLPKVPSGPINDSDTKNSFTIVIKKKDITDTEPRVYMNDKIMSPEAIQEKLTSQHLKDPALAVYIEGDREATYEIFSKVLAAVRNAGVQNVGIMTDPEEEKKAQQNADATPVK